MRLFNLICSILCASVSAQLVVLNVPNQQAESGVIQPKQQKPVMEPGPVLPPASQDNPPNTQFGDGDSVILSDVMGKDRSINIFAGFTRDIGSIADRLSAAGSNTTVLAPTNSAITSLSRKPWEDPQEYAALGADAYEGPDGEDRAHRNLRRFVESHVVPVAPWQEGEKVKTIAGQTVWWEKKDGKKLVSY